MQKMMKNTMALLAVVALVSAVFVGLSFFQDDTSAEIANGTCGTAGHEGEVTWVLSDDNVLTISGNGAMADYTEVMGDATAQPWSEYRAQIRGVYIGAGITHIGNYAFAGLTGTTGPIYKMDFENGSAVTSIGSHAFSDSPLFSMINKPSNFPSQYVTVGDYAFSGVDMNGNSIKIPDTATTIGDHAFDSQKVSEIGSNVSSIGSYAIKVGSKVTFKGGIPTTMGENALVASGTVSIMVPSAEGMTPETVRAIYPNSVLIAQNPVTMEVKVIGAAHDAPSEIDLQWDSNPPWTGTVKKVEYVNIEKIRGQTLDAQMAVRFSGRDARFNINIFESVVIDGQEQLVPIGDKGVKGYTDQNGDLRVYYIPSTVTSLGADDFPGVTNFVFNGSGQTTLKSLTIPSNATVIYVFDFRGIEYFKINAPLETNPSISVSWSYGSSVMTAGRTNQYCTAIKTYDISETRFTTFVGDIGNATEEIRLPSTITTIEDSMFMDLSSLKSINLENVTTIEESAFSNCTSLETVDLSSVTSVGLMAFYSCTGLKAVTVSDDCTYIGDDAFYGTSLRAFRIPQNITIDTNVWGNAPIETFELAGGYTGSNKIVEGVLFTDNGATLVAVPFGLDFYEVPDNVTTLAYSSMTSCSLKNLVIGSSVTSIGDYAFCENTSLITIYWVVGDGVVIGSDAFSDMTGLTKVYYEGETNPATLDASLAGLTVNVTGAANQFTITFNTNGGSEIDQIAFDVYLTETEAMPTPVKAGSVFCGWYNDALLTSYAGSSIPMGTIGSKTFYAKWALPTDFVDGASVIAFSGSSAVIRIDAASVPSGDVIVRYSEYIDIAEGKVLFPFMTGSVSVGEGVDTVAFINGDGKAIESASVTFRYTIGAVAFYTPLSYANAPANEAKADITIDSGLSLNFDGKAITSGTVVEYGSYEVEITGGQTVALNGIVWTNGDRFFYCGQKLVITKVA